MEGRHKDFPAYPKQGSYFDSATINLQSKSVIEAQNWYNSNLGSVLRKSLYKRSRKSTEIYLETKEKLVSKFGGIVENYIFLPNLDYAWNIIINSIIVYHQTSGKDKPMFISSIFEEHSLLAPLIQLSSKNMCSIKLIRSEQEFSSEIDRFDKDGFYCIISHISPLNGIYRDLQKISTAVKNNKGHLFVDLSRSSAQFPIRIASFKIDAAIIDPSLDLLGPQGICAVYLSELFYDVPSLFSGTNSVREVSTRGIDQLSSLERFEIGNLNLASLNGFKAALDYIKPIADSTIMSHRNKLQKELRRALSEDDHYVLFSSSDQGELGSVLSFRVKGISTHDISLLMEEAFTIEIRSGTLCSHPGLNELNLKEVLTVSTHIYNTEQEIDNLIESLSQARMMML